MLRKTCQYPQRGRRPFVVEVDQHVIGDERDRRMIAKIDFQARHASPLFALVGFFAFISASGAFLITSLWYALSSAARKYLLKIK